jgi:hypothetical protein
MIVLITSERGFLQAMGHRVALHLGGEPELKRRCLGSIAQLDSPPDEIRFERVAPDPEPASAAPAQSTAQPPVNSSAPTNSDPARPAPPPSPRSHKRR